MVTHNAPQMSARRNRGKISSFRIITALILREMSSTHGRSPGGYFWLVLEPVLGIMLLSFIFAYGFRTPPLGTSYAIYFATGMMPFAFFNDLNGKVSQSINYSKALLAYPRVTFVDAMVARVILTLLTQMLVSCLVFSGILLAFETRTVLQIERVFMAYAMATAFAAGVGTLNCYLFTAYPLWQRAWGIATRPLFLISGVLFLYEAMPAGMQDILWYNPLLHVTGEMRGAFYLQYEAKYVSPAFVFGVSLVLIISGLVLLRRYHRDMMER
ncbi:ABC transporter permease [Oceaniglobus trochenteri]|uniref:ABC transporter permease n=1 Tax=Oceaniglobus trochenteri TaxID=2763260 RepID=UPI001CFFDD5C|nr:ABC transporter permease [Oceaniglobus trochenteri]